MRRRLAVHVDKGLAAINMGYDACRSSTGPSSTTTSFSRERPANFFVDGRGPRRGEWSGGAGDTACMFSILCMPLSARVHSAKSEERFAHCTCLEADADVYWELSVIRSLAKASSFVFKRIRPAISLHHDRIASQTLRSASWCSIFGFAHGSPRWVERGGTGGCIAKRYG